MLLITQHGFVEILREPQFSEHLTVRAETAEALQPLVVKSFSDTIRHDPHQTYPFSFMAYEDEVKAGFAIPHSSWSTTETLRNISPEPVGYFVYRSEGFEDRYHCTYVFHSIDESHVWELEQLALGWSSFRYYPVYVNPGEIFRTPGETKDGAEDW